ncbi:MAG: hypothetical protein AAGE96_06180 [Cyanobacteria bacterium P01_G01_bin.19]
MNPKTSQSIKITSIILITAALCLEIWNIYLHLNQSMLADRLRPVLWLGSIALIAHGVEGIIAALNASSRHKNPFTYGIYTFFVGYVGLKELFEQPAKS